MSVRVHRYADAERLCTGVAWQMERKIAAAQAHGRVVSLCLSDGIGRVCSAFSAVAENTPVDAEKIDLWWSDDRFVDLTDPTRVSTRTLASLGTSLRFASDRVHPMPAAAGNPDVDTAAMAYAAELGDKTFDLAILSMGPDGSVAGLAPGSPAFTTPGPHSVVGLSDKDGDRLTLTLKTLASSQVIWLIASGADAADALVSTVDGDTDVPSGALRGRQETHVFADEAAASRLPWYTCNL